jgi:hypothetical protein
MENLFKKETGLDFNKILEECKINSDILFGDIYFILIDLISKNNNN